MSRITRAVLGAALLAAAVPSAADAATVQVDSGKTGPFRFHYLAAPGEVNQVRVAEAADGRIIISDTAPIRITGGTAAEGCRLDSVGDVVCDSTLFPHTIALGDGDDVIRWLASDRTAGIDAGNGDDTIFAGVRRNASGVLAIAGGAGAADKVTYASASFPATVSLDGEANDGVRGDVNNVQPDVEIVEGTAFGDTITGSNAEKSERFIGGGGNDTISGLGGSDKFDEGTVPNGADTFNGGAGIDLVDYDLRSAGVNVSLDLQRNDGAPGEQDFVDPNVNDIASGSGPDVITGSDGPNTIITAAGTDEIVALKGDDHLVGGPGFDRLFANAGNDRVDAVDLGADLIRCDVDHDVLFRDAFDSDHTGCDVVNDADVGILDLAPKTLAAKTGVPAKLRLSWTHPKGWKQLQKVTLRLRLRDEVVGSIAIRPRAERISDAGAVQLVRRTSRLSRHDKTVTARLALRLDPALAGKRLRAEVRAVDMRGVDQVERDAGTVRVSD